MTDMRQRLAELSPAQRELLLRRLAATERPAPEPSASPRDEAPLTFAQERQWFIDSLSPADPTHIITGALRLDGELSVPALSRAVDAIVARHEPLRTAIVATPAGPVQRIAPPAPLPIRHVDFTGMSPHDRDPAVHRTYAEETDTGFDLSRAPLLRLTLVALAPDRHFLIFALHHIVGDGWSIGVFLDELTAHYSGATLPPLARSYGDLAIAQRSGRQQRGLAYWRAQLADPPPVLDLPPDRNVPRERDGVGASVEARIDPQLRTRLDAIGQTSGSSLFATMLTAFMTLLMRVTGRDDVIVGSPVSGRVSLDSEPLIGLFLNTLALRGHLSPRLAFADALAQMRDTILDGLEHHDVPFDQVVREAAPDRDARDHPLFETFFNFTPSPPRTLDWPGVRASFVAPPVMRCEFSLVLYVTEWQGALELRLVYQQARYTAARMRALLDQYVAVLSQAADDPTKPLGAFDLAGGDATLSDPRVPLAAPAQEPVATTILRMADRTPEAPAITQHERTLTYADLARGMAHVAARLRDAGISRGDVVAVHGVRSPDYVVAMVAVLLAGGVLLTLDPSSPVERRLMLVENSGARCVLHAGPWRDEDGWLREEGDRKILPVALDDAPPNVALPTVEHVAGLRDPAYIFFTSGSTGTPKGVVGTAAGLAHFLAWQRDTFAVRPCERFAQLTGMAFDVVLRDIFLPLTAGAELVIPTEDEGAASGRCLAWLRAERIASLHTVPSVATAWLAEAAGQGGLPDLRRAFFAGEPLTASLARRWREAISPKAEIVNLYGPTETTLAKSFHRLPAEIPDGVQPLGRPLQQTQTLVLTPLRRQCGIGEIGEIAIRTPFRTLGYHDAPAETARRFIVNSYTGDPDDRLYLTGDRGFVGADGLLHFVGRIDDQVKVRGVRVEPTEVAACLASADGVAASAVVVASDPRGDTALVAYVVPAPGAARDAAPLREHLRRHLPAAMIPAAFTFVEELPLTANHKLDRSRLPAVDWQSGPVVADKVAPGDAMELLVAQVWRDILESDAFGVTDDFFDVGGHSLLALRMLTLIEQRTGARVPLAVLFERPTIAHLATVARTQGLRSTQVVKLWAGSDTDALFLVHSGGGTVLNYLPLVRHLALPTAVYAIQARGLDGEAPPQTDVTAMAADYIALLRSTQPMGPYRIAGHSFGGVVAYEMARQLEAGGETVSLLVMFDAVAPGEDRVADDGEPDERTVTAAFRTFAGLDPDTDEDAMQLGGHAIADLVAVARAHRSAAAAYRPLSSPVPITLLRAEAGASADPTLGWAAISPMPVSVHVVPGDHVTMMDEGHAAALAIAVKDALTRSA